MLNYTQTQATNHYSLHQITNVINAAQDTLYANNSNNNAQMANMQNSMNSMNKMNNINHINNKNNVKTVESGHNTAYFGSRKSLISNPLSPRINNPENVDINLQNNINFNKSQNIFSSRNQILCDSLKSKKLIFLFLFFGRKMREYY